MDEFERQMREELRGGQTADDGFVARVGAEVAREERRRRVGLSLAAAAALVLIVLAGLGVGLAAAGLAEMFAMPFTLDPSVIDVAAPAAGVLLLAAVAFPLMRRR